MCVPPGARPPVPPADLRTISGGDGPDERAGDDVIITSEDATRFRAYLARAGGEGDAGVVIAPDVRGLHPFYEELAERFAAAGLHAIAIDYFGRTAGTERRPDDFPFREHSSRTTPAGVQADVAAAIGHLRGATEARRVFVVGFCFGGRVAFNAGADQHDLAGVVGFYGVTRRRDEGDHAAPIEKVDRMRAPVLGLFGGADGAIPAADNEAFDRALAGRGIEHHLVTYPGAPHSFFDRSFAEHRSACDDAWRRVLGFIATGDPAARA
ncbi:MAG: dienelactone hydrolase family protein [Candidatus Limnocylindria bacterium]